MRRGPRGIWKNDPKAERLSNLRHYMADREVRKLAWRGRVEHPAWRAVPNAGHRAPIGEILPMICGHQPGQASSA